MIVRIPPLAAAGLAALAALDLWLLTFVVAGVAGSDPATIAAPAWNPTLPNASEDIPAARPIHAYRETLVHPIFFKTREPYVPPPRPIAAPAPAALPKPPPAVVDPGLIVGGVIISRDVRRAYVYGKADSHGHGTWVKEGEVLTGWKVVAIDPGGVKLQQQDRTIELHLYPPR